MVKWRSRVVADANNRFEGKGFDSIRHRIKPEPEPVVLLSLKFQMLLINYPPIILIWSPSDSMAKIL